MKTILSVLFALFALGMMAQPEDSVDMDPGPVTPQGDPNTRGDEERAAMLLNMKDFKDQARGREGLRISFYNVENLFDTLNDPLTRDDDFTPRGTNGWSAYKYYRKLDHIYKTLSAVGGWENPDIMGFCEVENRAVVEDIIKKTPFRKEGYEVVHENSTDARGIDVALIYKKSKFKYLSHEAIRPRFPFDTTVRTRDVLYVRGIALDQDTLHVFVNHWPSRLGGMVASQPRRVYIAGLIRHKVDSLLDDNPNAKIIIMGDLNDESENKSVVETLRAKGSKEELKPRDLFGYMHALSKNWKLGSEKFREHWGIIDHIIVSQGLLRKQPGRLSAAPEGGRIFAAEFLLKEDERYFGLAPFRTFVGPRYIGGFSDHLPIYIDVTLDGK